jgi:hypothetical protein
LENSHLPATLTRSEGWPSPLRVFFFCPWVGMGYLFSSLIWSEHRPITPLPPPTELQDPAVHSFVAQHLSRSQPAAGANKHVIFNNQRSFQSTINEVFNQQSTKFVALHHFFQFTTHLLARHVRARSPTLPPPFPHPSISPSPSLPDKSKHKSGTSSDGATGKTAKTRTKVPIKSSYCPSTHVQLDCSYVQYVFSDHCSADIPPL